MHIDPAKNRNLKVAPDGALDSLAASGASAAAAAAAQTGSGQGAGTQRALPQPPRPGDDLHVCRRCYSDLVYPVDWAESGPVHWEVALRCPECWWEEIGVFPQSVVERFDIELDRGAEILLRDLQHLAHANMADYVER